MLSRQCLEAEGIWLKSVIEDRSAGALLDARERPQLDGSNALRPGALFRSPSGALHRYYIDVGALFREPAVLDRLIRYTGAVLNSLCDAGLTFDALLPVNSTAGYISEYLQPHFHRETTIEVLHWTDHISPSDERLKGKRLILLLDVFACGSVVRKIVSELQAREATVVAAVALVYAHAANPVTGSLRAFTGTPHEVALYYLTSVSIGDEPQAGRVVGPTEDIDASSLLRRLVLGRRNGMLLDAKHFAGSDHGKGIPAFELHSGRFQQHFVTVWGIFDKPWYFDECVHQMAQIADQIRQHTGWWFNAIVTCTATAKHLVEHLQPYLETRTESIDTFHLGPYPFHTVRRHGLLSLKGKSVLVVTDVIASNKMVRNIASAVERLGGSTKAILAVAQLLESEDETRDAVEIEHGKVSCPVRSITRLTLPSLSDVDNVLPIPVDPTTVLPVDTRTSLINPRWP